jgi:hypothetical protein
LKYTADLLHISIIEAPRIIEAERINCRVEVQRGCRIHSYSLGRYLLATKLLPTNSDVRRKSINLSRRAGDGIVASLVTDPIRAAHF